MARWLGLGWFAIFCMLPMQIVASVAGRTANMGMAAQLVLDGPVGHAAVEYFGDVLKQSAADGATPMPLPKAADQPAAAGSSAKGEPTEDDVAESRKILNDAIAYIRVLAQLHGRNADWAAQAVRGAATLTASEAARRHVIDFVASDVPDLLVRADGRKVQLDERGVTLQIKGASVREYAPGARTRFLAIIAHPTIAYLLLLAGIFGLLLEALHPGAMLPGIAGGICLLAGFYALQLLPVNYAGLALMALGIGLLVAEAVNPTVGAFGAGGLVSFVVGSVMLMNTDVPGYSVDLGVIAGIAVCAAGLLALIVWLVFRSRRARQVTGDAAMLTDTGELLEPMSADGESWMMVRGERWRVRCDTVLPAGARVRVVRRQGLLLWVEPAQAGAAGS